MTVVPVGPTPRSERSLAPDLARGSVLLFIALANVSTYHFGRDLNVAYRPVDGSALDRALDFVVSLMIDQRSYPMFAVLFGYGLSKMIRRAVASGRSVGDGGRILVRRQLWLLAFGAVHATLLFAGDILGAYAATGLLALLFVGIRSTRVLVWVGIALLVPLTLTFGLSGLDTSPPPYIEAQSYLGAMAERAFIWGVTVVSIGVTFALVGPFLIGMALERSGLVDRPWEHRRRLAVILGGGLIVNFALGTPHALHVSGVWEPGPGPSVLAASAHALSGVGMGLGYVCLFALVAAAFRGKPAPVALRPLTATGERSLTAYLLQSVALAPLMSAWGLGLGRTLSSTQAYGLALAVWAATVAVAAALGAAGRRGPAEILLRRLTYPAPPRLQRRPAGATVPAGGEPG